MSMLKRKEIRKNAFLRNDTNTPNYLPKKRETHLDSFLVVGSLWYLDLPLGESKDKHQNAYYKGYELHHKKRRPYVVLSDENKISNDENASKKSTIIVAPLTSKSTKAATIATEAFGQFFVPIQFNSIDYTSFANLTSLRTCSKDRFVECVGFVSNQELDACKMALRLILDLQQKGDKFIESNLDMLFPCYENYLTSSAVSYIEANQKVDDAILDDDSFEDDF